MGFNSADFTRRIENAIKIGTIQSVDYENKKIRVQTGELITNWLDWPTETGRNFRRWRPLREGTQVILASPSGQTAQAVIIGMLYTDEQDAPSTDPDVDLIQFENGALLSHNISTNEMKVICKGDANITVTGDVNLTASGNINEDATMIHMNKGTGVVTGECICPFTGCVHPDISSTVTAGK